MLECGKAAAQRVGGKAGTREENMTQEKGTIYK